MEHCVGCGVKSKRHPVVGIATRGDVDGDRVGEQGDYVAHPMCERCWREPTRRKIQGMKLHFFPRRDMGAALATAGSHDIGG